MTICEIDSIGMTRNREWNFTTEKRCGLRPQPKRVFSDQFSVVSKSPERIG